MLLAIDAGNTNVTFGVYDDDSLRSHYRIRTQAGRTAHEYAALLRNLFTDDGLAFGDIDAVAIASVVPPATPDLERLARDAFRCEPLRITADLDIGLKVAYRPPGDVGADRLVDAAAAIAKYGPAPLIVIDFGTATTFNAIGAGNVYLGGAIFPGISLAWDALFAHAARLHPVDQVASPAAIGDCTQYALQSGMTHAVAAMIEGMVARFRREMNAPRCPVIATGGQAADLVASISADITQVDALLTLDGIQIVWKRNRGLVE